MKKRLAKVVLGMAMGLILLTGPGCSGDLRTILVYQLVGAAGAIFQSLTGDLVSSVSNELIPSLISGATSAATTTSGA